MCALKNNEFVPNTAVSLEHHEPVKILLQHCQEMKRQESCLRLVTFLLLIGSATVFFLVHFMSQCGRSVEEKEEKVSFPHVAAITQQQDSYRPHALVTSPLGKLSEDVYVQWYSGKAGLVNMEGFTYNKTAHALVVPQKGRYYVYIGMNLQLPDSASQSETERTPVKMFLLHVITYHSSYPEDTVVMEVRDSIPAASDGERTVHMGHVVKLEKGALLRATVRKGSELIRTANDYSMYFGAHLL